MKRAWNIRSITFQRILNIHFSTAVREVREMTKKKTFILIIIAILATTMFLYTSIVQAEPDQDRMQTRDQDQLRECDPANEDCVNDCSGVNEQKQQKLQLQNNNHDEGMPGQHHAHHWYWDSEH